MITKTNTKENSNAKSVANTHFKKGIDVASLNSIPVLQNKSNQSKSNFGIIQMIRSAPAGTGGAIAHAGNATTFDDQAPQTIDQFNHVLAAVAADRDTALANIRAEYSAIGTSLGNGGESYISRNTINQWRAAAGANGSALYHRLVGAGVAIVAPAAGAAATDNQRSMQVHAYPQWRDRGNLDHLLNWGALPLLDPLKVTITSPVHGGGQVIADVEFTEAHRGYVSRVNAIGSNAPMARIGQYGSGLAGNPRFDNANDTVNPLDSYSMTHHSVSNTTADAQMNAAAAGGSTLREKEEGVDALTKVIAEGGRFQCVAALGSAITNDTKFFTRDGIDPLPISFKYIEFRNLWTRWSTGFGKRYNIPNNDVRDYINNENAGVVTINPQNEADIPNVWPVDASPRVDLS